MEIARKNYAQKKEHNLLKPNYKDRRAECSQLINNVQYNVSRFYIATHNVLEVHTLLQQSCVLDSLVPGFLLLETSMQEKGKLSQIQVTYMMFLLG